MAKEEKDVGGEKTKKEKEILVVNELPSQQIKEYTDEKGTEFQLITIDEALTELINNTRKIKKAVV